MGYQALTKTEVEAIRGAYVAGTTTAASLKPGCLFLGAWGEAEKVGYGPGTIERAIFTTGVLAALPRPVETTWENVITKIGG